MARRKFVKTPRQQQLKKLLIFLSVLLVIVIGVLIFKKTFTVTDITVVGNEHYTDEEIINFIITKPYERNSVVLYLKYNNKTIKDIPFVEQMDVQILSPTSVKIMVYEKAIAGCVEYLGHYMYFDKDGVVVEGSSEMTDGVPFVTGLSFDHMMLYEELPVENQNVFMMVLNITQLLNKYEIKTDRIYFDVDYNITLYFGDSKVYLGSSDYIDEKINEMHFLLPKLEGFAGVLHMENYTGESGVFSFIKDEDEVQIQPEEAENQEENADNESEEASEQ